MELYNTLTKDTTQVSPIDGKTIRIYSCGPTVYDHAHIGNLSAYIFADTLRRTAKKANGSVKHVMNYTDVDDKTIRRSQEMYPNDEPKNALQKLTNHYIELFLEDMQKVGNKVDNTSITFVRATETIAAMQKLITELVKAGFAYIADDGVYFSIQAYKNSGKTYGQLLQITSDSTSTARIQNDEYDKESVHDFALWKKQKSNEPAWDYVIDEHDLTGRPGWHIECSVMSHEALGQPFDIHTGGIDLIFPHHENEIAQSTALTSNPTMATVFCHNNHVLVDGKKMAKSAQNFYTLADIEKKGFDPLAFRLLVLQSHYRNETHFSWENLEAAQNTLQKLRMFANWPKHLNIKSHGSSAVLFSRIEADLAHAMDDDLNTPQALFHIATAENQLSLSEGEFEDESAYEAYKSLIETIDSYLGLDLGNQKLTTDQETMLTKRRTARETKDWALSDQLRDELASQGILVRDTKHGQVWSRA